jgi:hypothetical protein
MCFFAHVSSLHCYVTLDGGRMRALENLVLPGGFLPCGSCYLWTLWTPGLISLHVFPDSLVALCLSILIPLAHFGRKSWEIPFRWIYPCFDRFSIQDVIEALLSDANWADIDLEPPAIRKTMLPYAGHSI